MLQKRRTGSVFFGGNMRQKFFYALGGRWWALSGGWRGLWGFCFRRPATAKVLAVTDNHQWRDSPWALHSCMRN